MGFLIEADAVVTGLAVPAAAVATSDAAASSEVSLDTIMAVGCVREVRSLGVVDGRGRLFSSGLAQRCP